MVTASVGSARIGECTGFRSHVVFSLAVIVVIANTIRLDVANRCDEIQVLSLVGAGNGFIRQPFLYSGFWYGFWALVGAGILRVLYCLSASPSRNCWTPMATV